LPASPRALVALEERVAPARRYTVIHAGRPVLIDHILASPALAAACEEVEILNGGLQDEVFAVDPIEGSLHAPLVATIGFLEAP
jgi:exonuclease III